MWANKWYCKLIENHVLSEIQTDKQSLCFLQSFGSVNNGCYHWVDLALRITAVCLSARQYGKIRFYATVRFVPKLQLTHNDIKLFVLIMTNRVPYREENLISITILPILTWTNLFLNTHRIA